MNTRKAFIKSILSEPGSEEYSSRRVVGFSAFLLLVLIVIADVWIHFYSFFHNREAPSVVSEFMFKSLETLVLGIFLFTSAQSVAGIIAKKQVASTIAENDPGGQAIEGAQDILKEDKPS